MDEEISSLQAMVEYYRAKSYKLEHEYLSYKLRAESIIKNLQVQLQDANESRSAEGKPAKPA